MSKIVSFGQVDKTAFGSGDCEDIKRFEYSPEKCNYGDLEDMWPTLDDYFENSCHGKESCQIDLNEVLVAQDKDLRPVECS